MPESILEAFTDETPEMVNEKVNARKITWEDGFLKSPNSWLLDFYHGNFVLDSSGCFYADLTKYKDKRFHTEILFGFPVTFAGECRIQDGKIEYINNRSGHYEPPVHNFYRALQHLNHFRILSKRCTVEDVELPDLEKRIRLSKCLEKHVLLEDIRASKRNLALNQKLRNFCLNSEKKCLDLSQTGLKKTKFQLIAWALLDRSDHNLKLFKIDLSRNPELTDIKKFLIELMEKLPSLKEIELKGTRTSKGRIERIHKNERVNFDVRNGREAA